LEKLIEWCDHHQNDPPPPPVIEGEEDLTMFNDEIEDWDKEFLKIEDSVLFDLILVRMCVTNLLMFCSLFLQVTVILLCFRI